MNKKTKIGIIVVVVILVIAIIAAVVIFTNPFEQQNNEDREALNEQENSIINNTVENNEVVNEEENITVNEEENNSIEEPEENTGRDSGYEANTSDEEKAIELVKEEWGEDDTVVFDLSGVTADGKYRVSVNRDTKVLAWYIVDVEAGTVTQANNIPPFVVKIRFFRFLSRFDFFNSSILCAVFFITESFTFCGRTDLNKPFLKRFSPKKGAAK